MAAVVRDPSGEPVLPIGVNTVDGVIVGICVRLARFVDERVDGEELARLRVVVTPYSITVWGPPEGLGPGRSVPAVGSNALKRTLRGDSDGVSEAQRSRRLLRPRATRRETAPTTS